MGRREYLRAIHARYQRSKPETKGTILDEFCSVCGYHRKYAIRLLAQLARKCGKKVFGVGMHHDPRLSSRRTAVVNWGHSWVLLGVVVQFRFAPERCASTPWQMPPTGGRTCSCTCPTTAI